MKVVKLNIGGRTINVRSNSDEVHLNQVADELNERITQTMRVIPDSHEALLFVALALTDELIEVQNQLAEIQEITEDKVMRLVNLFEQLTPIPSTPQARTNNS